MINLEFESTIKYALLIEYDGNGLVGWQKQDIGVSVQGSLEKVAKQIFNDEFHIQGSGRTDAGVHALGQVAHIKLPSNHRLTSKNPFYIISDSPTILFCQVLICSLKFIHSEKATKFYKISTLLLSV